MPKTLKDDPITPTPDPTPTDASTPAPQAAVPWNVSLKFRSYVSAELLLVIGWLIENLSTHKNDFSNWTWIAVTVSTLTLLAAIVRDWADPAVIAPFAVLNKNNIGQ